jgi:hypothetical protein
MGSFGVAGEPIGRPHKICAISRLAAEAPARNGFVRWIGAAAWLSDLRMGMPFLLIFSKRGGWSPKSASAGN